MSRRVTIDLSDKASERVEAIRSATGLSISEIFRAALFVFDLAHNSKYLYVEECDGNTTRIAIPMGK